MHRKAICHNHHDFFHFLNRTSFFLQLKNRFQNWHNNRCCSCNYFNDCLQNNGRKWISKHSTINPLLQFRKHSFLSLKRDSFFATLHVYLDGINISISPFRKSHLSKHGCNFLLKTVHVSLGFHHLTMMCWERRFLHIFCKCLPNHI